jgi:hypothetical protein
MSKIIILRNALSPLNVLRSSREKEMLKWFASGRKQAGGSSKQIHAARSSASPKIKMLRVHPLSKEHTFGFMSWYDVRQDFKKSANVIMISGWGSVWLNRVTP